MHKSSDTKNFRNQKYLENMEQEFKRMFRAYHKYLAYRNKLRNELALSDNDVEQLNFLDQKFIKNINKAEKRIQKEDFENDKMD